MTIFPSLTPPVFHLPAILCITPLLDDPGIIQIFVSCGSVIVRCVHRGAIGSCSWCIVGKPEVILGADLFGGQVVNALLYCVGLSQTDPLPVSKLRQFSDLATKVSRKKTGSNWISFIDIAGAQHCCTPAMRVQPGYFL